MSNWDYAREETPVIGAGEHRFEVVEAEEKQSNSGNDMIVVGLRPNGSTIVIRDYFVKGEYFNRKMTQFFDATNINEGDFNIPTWIGAVGAARFKVDESGYLKVQYYLNALRAEKLPPWQGTMPERQTITDLTDYGDEVNADEDDMPF